MQIPILICLVLVSVVQAALVTRIPKPKLSSLQSQTLHIAEPPKHKTPEERRKFSLFPKMYMKYVISPEPIYKIEAHKPIVHGTKKPIMKKMNLLGKKNEAVEIATQQSIIDAQPEMHGKNIDVTPKINVVYVSKEVVEEKSEESKEKQNDNSEEQQNNNSEEEGNQQNENSKEDDEKHSGSNEITKSTTDSIKNKSPNLKDLILPPEAKPAVVQKEQSKGTDEESKDSNELKTDKSQPDKLQNNSNEIKKSTVDTASEKSLILKDPEAKPDEVSQEIKNIEIADEKEKMENDDAPDFMEFIFIDSAHKVTESDKNSNDEEEYITTEYYIDQEIQRIKRGSNIIEEENLASTVAGYKYTLKDTRLNNDVAFRNIHS